MFEQPSLDVVNAPPHVVVATRFPASGVTLEIKAAFRRWTLVDGVHRALAAVTTAKADKEVRNAASASSGRAPLDNLPLVVRDTAT